MLVLRSFKSKCAFIALAATHHSVVLANDPPPEAAWNATFENDVFFGSDRNYTNGVQLERIKGIPTKATDGEGPSLWLRACAYLGCAGHQQLTVHHKLGQLMYTPENIGEPRPQPQERPWAGLLYYTQEHVFQSPDGNTSTKLVGQFGVIGPAALSKDSQTLVHRIIDSPKPLGWKNQSGNELVGLVMVERRSALPGLSGGPVDGLQWRSARQWRVAAGTLMTFAGAGFDSTIGTNLPPLVIDEGSIDIQSKRLRAMMHAEPGLLSALAVSSKRTPGRCAFDWLDCSVTASIEGRWMLHNVFLDGPVFRDGPSVDIKRLVADASLSLQLTFPKSASTDCGPWFVRFKASRRSPEFTGQGATGSHSFGALTVGRHFY